MAVSVYGRSRSETETVQAERLEFLYWRYRLDVAMIRYSEAAVSSKKNHFGRLTRLDLP